MTKHKNDSSNLHHTFMAFSKLLVEFNLDFDIFCKTLREYYVRETYKSSKTMVQTSLRSNIDRRIVADILNNKKQCQKPSLLLIVIDQIEAVAKNNKMQVNKKGIKSIESIMDDVVAGSISLKSVINELVALGCIKDRGEKITFISNKVNNNDEKQKALRDFSCQLNNYVNKLLDD